MRESISNAYILMIVIVIIGLCATVMMSSLAYSKTFKVKNRIVEILEKHKGYNEAVESEIAILLKSTGYPTITKNETCPVGRGVDIDLLDPSLTGHTAINTIEDYKYCIYKYQTVKGDLYAVTVYMTVQLPLLGNFARIEFPIYGETKVFNDF